ncbi:MAG: hypothetical protein EOR04_07640 [Mesorhizobium sp.]|uniref:VapE domain-containing protein n=1 Tax=Mesorhizobium sp. TaxID=1871066 RepID=UPI000FE9FEC4|nr:VapE domain-containing protein [Mesorhizobium sp.]RWP43525.1 MAG: hypothetical protein EOR04_07640 [Mesorhizobium sp.]
MTPSYTNSPDAAQVCDSNSACILQADQDLTHLLGDSPRDFAITVSTNRFARSLSIETHTLASLSKRIRGTSGMAKENLPLLGGVLDSVRPLIAAAHPSIGLSLSKNGRSQTIGPTLRCRRRRPFAQHIERTPTSGSGSASRRRPMADVGEYPRQCIFIGSTNDREYLRDQSGGRRFWPIMCKLEGQIDNPRLRREILQVWAEALHIYKRMEAEHGGAPLPLYLTADAAKEAAEMQESRRVETSEEMLAGKIMAWLAEPIGTDDRFDDLDPDAPKAYREETCVAQIWEEMMGRDGSVPHTEAGKIGKAMLQVGWRRSPGICSSLEINKKYGKCRVYTRPED